MSWNGCVRLMGMEGEPPVVNLELPPKLRRLVEEGDKSLLRSCSSVEENGEWILELQRVPDVWRYDLQRDGSKWIRTAHLKCVVNENRNAYNDHLVSEAQGEKLVLLLESPHEQELCPDTGLAIAPAQGSTGSAIEGKISVVFASLRQKAETPVRVLIVNPVPYMASMYHFLTAEGKSNWRGIRNQVWRRLFDSTHVSHFFLRRLSHMQPSVVINACTGGKSRYGLSRQVETWLTDPERRKQLPILFSCNHPAINWGKGKFEVRSIP